MGLIYLFSLADIASSSIFEDESFSWGPKFAHDGKVAKNSTEFFQSQNESYPWLELRIASRFPTIVSQVNIVNRFDDHGERFENIEIRAGMTQVESGTSGEQLEINTVCGHITGPGEAGEEEIITCDPPIPASYVTVQKLGQGILQINELSVNPSMNSIMAVKLFLWEVKTFLS